MDKEETAYQPEQGNPAQRRTVIHRLSRAIGHLESVRKMAEEGRDSADVLLQLSAVRGALDAVSRIVLKEYMERCMAAAQGGDSDALEELRRAIDQMLQYQAR